MKKDNESEFKDRYNFRYFLISFSIVFLLSFIFLFVMEKEVRSIQFNELKTNEERIVDLENHFLGKEFNMVLTDLYYLHHAFKDRLMDVENYDSIAINWKEFSTHRNIYDQVRFLDTLGNEKIRINLNKNGVYIVPLSDLQNKKERYYFYETVLLPEESVHISPLDLNIENGKIEEPYKPIIRFSTPLYDNGEPKGIIVLNYLAKNALESFRDLATNSRGEIILLNSNGYWLSSENEKLEWNFMFDNRKNDTFIKEYPEEWEAISSGKGQIITPNGLFTFSSVILKDKITEIQKDFNNQSLYLTDIKWYIVSSVSRDGNYKSLFIDNTLDLIIDVFKKNALYFLLMFLISIIVAFLVYLNRKTYSRIKYFSEYDTLTKVYNRRAGISRLNQLFPQDNQRNFLVSLCFIDVNGLKQVNDILGHKLGDELIITAVDVIKATIREYDFIIRLGGDEFLIVFDGIDMDMAEKVWRRIINEYEEINNTQNRPYLVSVSHGIVSYKNSQGPEVDDLIKIADEKMYEEKRIIKEYLNVIR